MALGCNANRCIYHLNGKCTSGSVQVKSSGGTSFCNTYMDNSGHYPIHETGKDADTERDEKWANLERIRSFKEEYAAETGLEPIECTVTSCKYNQDFGCRARNVEILFKEDEYATSCVTYDPDSLKQGDLS